MSRRCLYGVLHFSDPQSFYYDTMFSINVWRMINHHQGLLTTTLYSPWNILWGGGPRDFLAEGGGGSSQFSVTLPCLNLLGPPPPFPCRSAQWNLPKNLIDDARPSIIIKSFYECLRHKISIVFLLEGKAKVVVWGKKITK